MSKTQTKQEDQTEESEEREVRLYQSKTEHPTYVVRTRKQGKNGRIDDQGKRINFSDFMYKTSDPEEQDYLENHNDFNDRIWRVDNDDEQNVNSEKAVNITAKSNSGGVEQEQESEKVQELEEKVDDLTGAVKDITGKLESIAEQASKKDSDSVKNDDDLENAKNDLED